MHAHTQEHGHIHVHIHIQEQVKHNVHNIIQTLHVHAYRQLIMAYATIIKDISADTAHISIMKSLQEAGVAIYVYTVKLGWSVYGYSIGKTNNSQIGKRLNVLYIHVHRYNNYYTCSGTTGMLYYVCINTCCCLPGPNQRRHFEKQTMCAGVR